jgi:ABC-type transport system involved in multi-copper enzyme maturation permease subunit
MIHLITHLYRRSMRKGRLIGLTALSAVPAVLFPILVSSGLEGAELGEAYIGVVTSAGYTFAIAALVIAGGTLREERDSGTLAYIYMRPYSRLKLALASVAAGAGTAVTLGLAAWGLTVLTGLLVGAGLSITGPAIALFVPAAIGYAAVFVPLGYLFSRSLLIGLGYVLIGETILAFVIPGLAQLSIWRIAMSIYASIQEFGTEGLVGLGAITPGAGGGIAKLAAVLVLGIAILTWALRKRDAL